AINILSETFALDPVIRDGDDIELSAYSHVREILTNHSKMVCCNTALFQPGTMDFLWLVSAYADHNIFKVISFLLNVQGSADKAELALNRFRRTYEGHPLFYFYESLVNQGLAKKAREPMRTRLIKQAVSQANSAYYWAKGQTPEAKTMAEYLLGKLKIYPYYHADFPRRDFWFIDEAMSDRKFNEKDSAELDNLKIQLDYTAFDFGIFTKTVGAMEKAGISEEQINKFIQSLPQRFDGHKEKALFTAVRAINQNNIEQAKIILSEDIDSNPASWESYKQLGKLYLKENEPQKAVEIFTRYPYFSDSKNINKVGLANNASSVVQLLFLRGFYQEAMPFISIGTKLHTGSASNLISDYYLSLYQNNYAQSIALSRKLFTRYNMSSSLDTYLQWLHAYGYNDMAFSIFQSIKGKKKSIVPWKSAATGLRMGKSSPEEIVSWLDDTATSPSADKALFVFEALAIDAQPPVNIQTLIDQAYINENAYINNSGKIYIKIGDRGLNLFAGPDSYNSNDQREMEKNTSIPSTIGSFANAYALLVNEKYDQALSAFQERTKYFSNTTSYFRYGLPYFVWSHIKAGQQEKISAYLETLSEKDIYVKFSKSLLLAVNGKQEQALALLDEFIYSLEPPSNAPFSFWYMLVELLEWVYEETNDRAYADLALKWSKHQQVLEPFTAWPYAIEAKLAKDAKQRLYALGIAMYLDPTSRRVNQFNSKTKRYAEKFTELKNPFTTSKPSRDDIAI
ncbi:MAG: hypothetical protein R3240_05640, partial [Gammaproteobacteria bacterium]|nr:hypothetical protein [Gammaproteobacteria bacterium]